MHINFKGGVVADEQEEIAVEQEENCEASEESTEQDLLQAAKDEAAEYKDKYLRAHADFENSKKRLEKDKNNAVAYAVESFSKDLLAVMDSFDQALLTIESLQSDNEALDKVNEGVKLTHEQLQKVLAKHHIVPIECDGEFDPEVHQAIMQEESSEHEEGQIVRVMQKGYMIHDRVLRPAMVSTCKA